jgi:hypothetical protein
MAWGVLQIVYGLWSSYHLVKGLHPGFCDGNALFLKNLAGH